MSRNYDGEKIIAEGYIDPASRAFKPVYAYTWGEYSIEKDLVTDLAGVREDLPIVYLMEKPDGSRRKITEQALKAEDHPVLRVAIASKLSIVVSS